MPVEKLVAWRELAANANIDPKQARALEQAADLLGADPTQWYGTTSSVASSDCKLQFLDGDVWRDFTVLTEMIQHCILAFGRGELDPVRPRLVNDTIWGGFVDRVSRTLVGK